MVMAAFWILKYLIWSRSGPRWFREAFKHFWDRKIRHCHPPREVSSPPKGRVQILKTNWTFFHSYFGFSGNYQLSERHWIRSIGLHLNCWHYISGCRVPCSWVGCWCSAGRPTTTPSPLTPSSGRASFPSHQRCGSGFALDVALLDPDPYWGCGSGSSGDAMRIREHGNLPKFTK